MSVHIVRIPQQRLREYARVPSAFEVRSRMVLAPDGMLIEETVDPPVVKDYDRFDPPEKWPEHFDTAHWGAFLAVDGDGKPAGGAVVARDTPGMQLLEDRLDVALLWDLRVRPDLRRQGVGKELFDAAIAWAREQGCVRMKIETQNINVAACRFYAARGAWLVLSDGHAYDAVPEVKHETMFMWTIEL